MDMNIKGVDEGLIAKAKIAAIRRGVSLKVLVVGLIEEAVNGDDAGAAERGGKKDIGKRAADAGGNGEVQDVGQDAGRVRVSERKADVRVVRGDVSRHGGRKGEHSKNGSRKVLRPSTPAQSDAGQVGGSVPEDREVAGSEQDDLRRFDPAHDPECDCGHCPEVK